MPTLADAILQSDTATVSQLLRYSQEVNEIDEYGFRPLIEAAIMDNIEMCRLLLQHGADPNLQDVTGGTALHWAVENNNAALCQLLVEYKANPNAYNLAGQPVLVMAILRQQTALKEFLIQAGANLMFAQDFINTKTLGHIFELVGTANIVTPKREFVEVDFEGFILEITINLIADSLAHFQNHFAARQLRRFSGVTNYIVQIMQGASQLIKYQQYRTDRRAVKDQIERLLKHDPIILPLGYEGHAIAFVRYGDLWVKCDRREESRLYDNVMVYRITRPENLTVEFLYKLLYEKQNDDFVNKELDVILGLQPVTEVKVEAQISGNCSWANIEATIPAIFFLVLLHMNQDKQSISYYKTLALNFFHRWRDWNKDRTLHYLIDSFKDSQLVRKASKAEILAAILFQRFQTDATDRERIDSILELIMNSEYDYIINNYLRIYYYESYTEEGKRFYELLREKGYIKR